MMWQERQKAGVVMGMCKGGRPGGGSPRPPQYVVAALIVEVARAQPRGGKLRAAVDLPRLRRREDGGAAGHPAVHPPQQRGPPQRTTGRGDPEDDALLVMQD